MRLGLLLVIGAGCCALTSRHYWQHSMGVACRSYSTDSHHSAGASVNVYTLWGVAV